MPTATLEIHICDQRRSYLATFTNQDQAVAFLTTRTSTHAFHEIQDTPVPQDWTALLDFLYPLCEHGMSLDLCEGPNHYMTAEQEQAMGWDYSDAPAGF